MAHGNTTPVSQYRPEMDGPAHEGTYDGFTHFTVVGSIFVVTIVLILAVGGVKHAWASALVMLIVSLVATGIGLFSKTLAWRPPAVVMGILLLMLLLY